MSAANPDLERVYLDWNATTPPLPEVLDAMMEVGRNAWGNPASVHGDGRRARRYVEDARIAVADLVSADARDVVLTSGGTEANNLAIRSAFPASTQHVGAGRAPRVLVTRAEHPSVLRVCEALEREGLARLRVLDVREGGELSLPSLEAALAEEPEPNATGLVCLQAVNHETGAIQPVAEAIALCHVRNVPIHVDAVQVFGRIDPGYLFGADSLAIAAHKLRGPKGIGALVSKPQRVLRAYTFGGAQERGLRPGTVDPVAAAGFAVAARHAKSAPERYARVSKLRDRLELGLAPHATSLPEARPRVRAPHVTNLVFPGWEGPELVAALDLEGVSVSSGSACSAGTSEPSAVMALLVGDRARSAVRVSLGADTTEAELDFALRAFERVLARGV